jgi:hypothetical protein
MGTVVLGCSGALVTPPPRYDTGGVAVLPQELKIRRGKLELKFTFVNRTDKVMHVDRDQMMVRLPDGSVRGRFKGTFSGMGRSTHTLMPGLSHNVFMDFMVGDLESGSIALVLSGVIVEGRPLPLPDYVMTVHGE